MVVFLKAHNLQMICPLERFKKLLCATWLWWPPRDFSAKQVQRQSDRDGEVCTNQPTTLIKRVFISPPPPRLALRPELNAHFFPHSALKSKIQESKRRPLMEKDKRILEELRSLHCDPHPYFTIFPTESDFSKCRSCPRRTGYWIWWHHLLLKSYWH